MDTEISKAIYINLFLLASADGKIDPAEREYLGRFAAVAGISEEQATALRGEVEAGANEFRPISDPDVAGTGLAVMARMVRVDGEFGAEEQAAYVNLGKALGWSQEELGGALREYWDRDPLVSIEQSGAETASGATARTGIAIGDDMGDEGAFERAAGAVTFTPCLMNGLERVGSTPDVVVFHVAEDRSQSSGRLEALRVRFPETPISFVARRDQAPQIGLLLGQGAARCFVEPLYPGEIEKALNEMLVAG